MGVRPRLVAQGDRDLTTTGTRFRRIERILDEALEREPSAREAYVREACKGDDGLRSEIEALLAAHDRAGNFLETAAVERFRGALLAEGERVGRYRILKVLGSGGGGTVYLAEQDQPRRHVALKAMHGGFSTDTAATRFEQEAEIHDSFEDTAQALRQLTIIPTPPGMEPSQ